MTFGRAHNSCPCKTYTFRPSLLHTPYLHEGLARQQRVQRWVECLAAVLQQHRAARPDAALQHAHDAAIGGLDATQTAARLHHLRRGSAGCCEYVLGRGGGRRYGRVGM
eukprot:356578-Chlamydomonas_euryale.AAC.2